MSWSQLRRYLEEPLSTNKAANFPANIYLFKVPMETLEWRQWLGSGAFIVNFKDTSHLFLVFLLVILNK